MTKPVLILNGPNLNMLGSREPEIYGRETLADVEKKCAAHAKSLKLKLQFFQSNSEGEIITRIQQAMKDSSGVIINAGALTHTSVAIMDALSMLKMPIIEVHLSNIYKREAFRHHSYVSGIATGVICGLGPDGYLFALSAIAARLK
jgi:3-dehydroquinate dehydratase II